MVRTRSDLGPALRGGILAGVIAGVVISAFLAVTSLIKGMDVWLGMKGAAAPFLGERAMQPGFDAVAVVAGIVSHMFISIVWGALFALLFYGLSKGATILAGLFWGIVVWIGMYYVVLPIVGLSEMVTEVAIAVAIIDHVLFGLVLSLAFLPFQRHIPRRSRREELAPPIAP